MSTIKVTISAELDGVQLAGYPKHRRLEVDESQGFSFEQATGGGHSSLPIEQLGTVQVLIIEPDQAQSSCRQFLCPEVHLQAQRSWPRFLVP